VGVDPGELAGYEWVGSTAEYHRSQIRRVLGFRRLSLEDEAKLAGWLADEVAPVELSDETLREVLPTRWPRSSCPMRRCGRCCWPGVARS